MKTNTTGARVRRRALVAAAVVMAAALSGGTSPAQAAAAFNLPHPRISGPPSPCSPPPSAVKVRILAPDDDTVLDLDTTPSLNVSGLLKGKGSNAVTGVELYLDDVDLGSAAPVATTDLTRTKGADFLWGRSIALTPGHHVLLACARSAAGPVALDSIHVVTAAVTTQSLPDALTGHPYSAQLTTTVPNPAWQIAGALPAGLTLSKAGLLAGTPTTPAVSALHLSVVDRKHAGMAASAVLTLKITTPGPASGTVCAWGAGESGELGDGHAFDAATATGTSGPVGGLSGVTAVAGTSQAAFGLRTDGTVWGWGSATYGQLGTAVSADTSTPAPVAGLSGITAVSGGFSTGYALRTDGTVLAWGLGGYANLGNGTYDASSASPVPVSGLSGVTAIAGAGLSAFALKSDGTVWGWGQGGEGQLGDQPGLSNSYSSSVPVQIPGLSSITAIAGNVDNGYALKSDGTVWAWGWGGSGALGNGTSAAVAVPAPVPVSALTAVTSIAAGAHNGYALTSDGSVWDWGQGTTGGLGNGSTADSDVPVKVSALASVTAIAHAIGSAQYAVKSDGTVWAWGLGDYGALGNGQGIGSYLYVSSAPVQVNGLSAAFGVAGGLRSGFALIAAGAGCAG